MCLITKNVRINQKIYIPNTLLVFEYLCNRANIRANQVFVSALLCMGGALCKATVCINRCYGIGVGVHGVDGHVFGEVTEEDET